MRSSSNWHWRAAAAIACCGAFLVAAIASDAAAPAHGAKTLAVSPCSAANTQVWLGDGEGGGVAGGYYYPLEFTNIGKRTCTLYGYPGVSGYRDAMGQVGKAAVRDQMAHITVTLAQGETANAQLKIADWGAICTKAVSADGLKVLPAGQTVAKEIGFSFQACASKGVLLVGPLFPGVGIPGYPEL